MSTIFTQCSKLKLNNNYYDNYTSVTTVYWHLYTSKRLIYDISNNHGDTDTINLSNRDLYYVYPGTKLVLKAAAKWAVESTVDVIIEYSPDSTLTAYFKYEGGSPFDAKLIYVDTK